MDWKSEFAYWTTTILAHAVLKFWVVTEASRRFSLDRQSGALELLLLTMMATVAPNTAESTLAVIRCRR